jgi:penicillin-binding protein 2
MATNYIASNEQESREYAPRYKLVYGLILFTTFIFGLRLWYLQIINGAELRQFSEQNSIKETKILAPRGIIYDRNGQILVENLPGFEALIAPQYIANLDEAAGALSRALKMPAANIVAMVQKSKRLNGPFRAVRIKDNLSREEIFSLELLKLDYSGVDIKEAVLRSYPLKEDGAQLFGYVGEISKKQLPILNEKFKGTYKFQQGDIIGKSGLEEYLDRYLRGRDGVSMMQVDARGREAQSETPSFLGNMAGTQDAVAGHNVIITIDRDIQETAFRAFQATGFTGGAVVMRTNGEVLAMINNPSFDPNEFSTGISAELWSKLINDPDKPLTNKVIQHHNSPGSTFKPLVAVAALCEKVVTATTVVSCPGQMKFGNRFYHDTLKGGHGDLVITQAIEQSANIFFYKMGIALGIDKMYKYIDALGIGHKTGIDLNGEVAGLMPSAQWKLDTIGEEWQPGENLSNAIGQGFVLTTPLQMAIAYNAIATYGQLVKPFLVKKVLTPDNKVIREFNPTVLRDLTLSTDNPKDPVVDRKVFETIKEGMRLVVNGTHGTARASKLPFIEMAGKTGTSQVMSFSADQIFISCASRPRHQRHHGWFIGYAPADKPEIVFGILAEHACHGSRAAPVAKEIVKAWVTKYHPEWLGDDVQKKKANLENKPAKQNEELEGE